jgi:hypothetical protein
MRRPKSELHIASVLRRSPSGLAPLLNGRNETPLSGRYASRQCSPPVPRHPQPTPPPRATGRRKKRPLSWQFPGCCRTCCPQVARRNRCRLCERMRSGAREFCGDQEKTAEIVSERTFSRPPSAHDERKWIAINVYCIDKAGRTTCDARREGSKDL